MQRDDHHYAVDLDGVVFDANMVMLATVNERFGTRYALDDMTAYDWYAWCAHDHAHHALTSFRDLLPSMPWLADGADAVRRLATAGPVSILTHRTPDLAPATALALAGLPLAGIHHVDRAQAKADLALRLGCTVALEDNPTQALAYAEAGLRVYLFAYPYNVALRHQRVRRVAGWSDVLAAEGLVK
ncbi:MAG: hypothetical protein IT340_13620 [Chloroflexi bacterium]|nr:hypothetical protein [Chloroflexota bacterium]